MVVVAVHEHLAEHAGLVGEHTAGDPHAVLGAVGGQRAGQRGEAAGVDAAAAEGTPERLRAVDAIALLRAHAHPHAVGQHDLPTDVDRADIEAQQRARLAGRIGHGAAIGARGAVDVGEAARQTIDHIDRAQRAARGLADGDRVLHGVADLGGLAVAVLADGQAGRHRGVQRQVVVDDGRGVRAGEQAEVVLRRRADRTGRCQAVRLHRVVGAGTAGRRQRATLRRNQCRHELVAARRRHGELEFAASRRGRTEGELVEAFAAHRHRDRTAFQAIAAAAGIEHRGTRVIAGTQADRRQGHDRARDRVARGGVIHHARRVHRQALLRQVLARAEHDFQLADAVLVDPAGADPGTRDGGRCVAGFLDPGHGFAGDRVRPQDAGGRIAEADVPGHAGHHIAEAVAAVGTGRGGLHHLAAGRVDQLHDPRRQTLVAAVQQLVIAADVVPHGTADRGGQLHGVGHAAGVELDRLHALGQLGHIALERSALGRGRCAEFILATAFDQHRVVHGARLRGGRTDQCLHLDRVHRGGPGGQHLLAAAVEAGLTHRAGAHPTGSARGGRQGQPLRQTVVHDVLATRRLLPTIAHVNGVRGDVVDGEARTARGLADQHVRRIADLAEVVAERVAAQRQHDLADRRGHGLAAGGHAGDDTLHRAGTGDAVEGLRRLGRLGHRIGARTQLIEAIAAVGIGGERDRDRLAQIVGAGQHHGDVGDAALTCVDHAVVVAVVVDAAGDAAGRDLTEVVVHRLLVHAQHQAGDLRRRGARRGHGATGAAGHGAAITGARRLIRLGYRVGARRQVAEAVVAVGIGDGVAADRMAHQVGAGQGEGDVGQAGFARVHHAIVVAVDPDLAADAAVERNLTKQVVHRGGARRGQVDRADAAGHRGHRRGGATADAVDGAGGGDAVAGAGRLLGFGQGVGARAQVGEGETAIGVGLHAAGDAGAGIVGTGQLDGDAFDAGFSRAVLRTVVVGVEEHGAGYDDGQHFTKVVADGGLDRRQHDRADRTGYARHRRGGADYGPVDGAGGRNAIDRGDTVEHRLRGLLGHRIGARQQVVEAVAPVGIGRDRRDRLAQCVHGAARQLHLHVGQAGFAGVLHAVVVAVQVDRAGERGSALAEVVAGGAGRGQVGDRDQVARGFAALGQAGRLGLGDAVVLAGHGAGIAVMAIGIGHQGFGGVISGAEHTVRAGAHDDHLHAGNADVAGVVVAVIVAVQVDRTADRGVGQLTEQVAGSILPCSDADAGDHVGHGGATRRGGIAGGVLAVQVGGRLGFRQRVAAARLGRQQIAEAVGTIGIGGRGQVDRIAEQVNAGERHDHIGDRVLAAVAEAVVVAGGHVGEIFIDRSGDRAKLLAEVIAVGAGQRQRGDVDLVARVLGRIGVALGLRFGDAVVLAHDQVIEGVAALRVGFHADGQQIVGGAIGTVRAGAGQGDGHVLQAAIGLRATAAGITGIEITVAVAVQVDMARNGRDRVFAEVEHGGIVASGQIDAGDAVRRGRIAARAGGHRAARAGDAADQTGIDGAGAVAIAALGQHFAQRIDLQRVQVDEAVAAVTAGGAGVQHGAGGIEQLDGGVGDRRITGIARVAVVAVHVDEAGQRGAAHFREVVAHGIHARTERDRGVDRVGAGGRRHRGEYATGRRRLRAR